MSNPAGEKTEKATPRRKSEARKEGQIAKSQDLNSGIILTIAFAVLFVMGARMLQDLEMILRTNLGTLDISEITLDGIVPFLLHHITLVIFILLPLFCVLVLLGIFSNLSQVGPLFTTKVLKPDIKKVNPISGAKRIVSMKGIVELIKGILKIAIIGIVSFFTIYPARGQLMALSNADLNTSLNVIFGLIFSLCWKVCIILLILGIFDYIYQRYEHEKSLKMTKQEVKDEHKNMEGNPEIKRKLKSTQMQMSQNKMLRNIEDADVVVTNPTHFAVALKYDPKVAPAPIVVAKGVDFLAKRIKERAKSNNVPIVENKPLARSLYRLVEVDRVVPEELFIAVAEVLAYVFKKNKKKQKQIKMGK